MSNRKTRRWRRSFPYLPAVTHVVELFVGVVILAAGQNLFAELVGANPDITPPSVPANVSMSGRTASSIDLSWDASTDDVGVTGYHVWRNGTIVATSATTTYSDPGLTPNTTYSYTISAFDAAANESAQSTPLSASTLADTSAPSIPSNLHQTGQTTSSISIAWNASTDNVAVTGYDIYRNGSLIRSQAGTTFTDTGLAVYTSYTYNITAHDGSNNASNLSSSLVASTAQDTTPPSVPDGITESGSTVSSVSLTWNASTDDVGVAGYHVFRNGVLIASPGGTSYTDNGLIVSSNYTYTISAFDAATNESAQSAPFSANSSNDTTPPTIPTNLHSTNVLDTSISIAWNASTDDVGVAGYKIYRDNSLIGTSTTTSFTDNGLTPVTGYTYTVKAYDAANNVSAASSAFPVTTAYDTTAPSTPANLRASSQTDTTITLAWDAATDNVGVTGYDVYRGSTLLTTTVGTNYTDTGLGVHTSYTYRVQAHDASGNNSAQSSPLTTSTLPDQVPPTAPSGLSSPGQTTTSIDLAWSAATDDVGVVSYNIYRNGTFIANVTATTDTDSALHYNTQYSYAVTALDAAGNESPASSTLTASTLPDTTAPTVNLTAPSNGQGVQFTIPITATASDDLELNHVEFYVDSTQVASQTQAPFGLNWNSYAVHNGSHVVTVKAVDASGNYATQAVTISVNNPPPPIVGDLNGDHRVNLFDLSILLSHWGRSGAGDFNNNGRVDIFDLSVLLSHYGQDNSNYH